MSEVQSPTQTPAVALLFEDADLGAHLRQALADLGARIVYEGPATKATREDLSGNGANVVIVNLDDTVERHLDALYEIFDENSQRIVFNDAEVSSGLSGWDQARWARHLAAKLMDAQYVDPPRPESARSIESHPTELMLPDAELPKVTPANEPRVSWNANDPGVSGDGEGLSEEDSANLTAELEALLAEDGDLLASHDETVADTGSQRASFDFDLGDVEMSDADDSGTDDAGAPAPGEAGEPIEASAADAPDATLELQDDASADAGSPDDATGETGDAGFEAALRQLDARLDEDSDRNGEHGADTEGAPAADDAAVDTDAGTDEDGLLSFEDIPELTDLQIVDPDATGDGVPEAAEFSEDEEAKASEDDADAPPAAAESSFSLVDPEHDEGHAPASGKAKVEAPIAPDWGLVDFDAPPEAQDDGGADADPKADSTDFGIEKLSAAEFLAPEGGEADELPDPSLSLELEPLEQAIAPKMVETSDHEMILDTETPNGIRRAVVIGAGSGEEALGCLREFVAALDRVPDAAMLCVIHHQGNGLEELARSLDADTTYLKVRVAKAGMQIRHGQMLMVPAGKQVAVDHSGTVQLLDAEEQSLASPSIDLTMTLVAQEMGADVLALVLAGDAIDALAGAQAVTDGGGKVWSMDPADCTDNTMVSVICEEQLALYTGTPQALAARLLEEYA